MIGMYVSPFCRLEVYSQGASMVSLWWESFLACRQLLFHCVLTWQGERGSKFSSVSTNKGTNCVIGALPSWPHLNLITSQRPHLLILSHWGIGYQHKDFERTKCSPEHIHNHVFRSVYVPIGCMQLDDEGKRILESSFNPVSISQSSSSDLSHRHPSVKI